MSSIRVLIFLLASIGLAGRAVSADETDPAAVVDHVHQEAVAGSSGSGPQPDCELCRKAASPPVPPPPPAPAPPATVPSTQPSPTRGEGLNSDPSSTGADDPKLPPSPLVGEGRGGGSRGPDGASSQGTRAKIKITDLEVKAAETRARILGTMIGNPGPLPVREPKTAPRPPSTAGAPTIDDPGRTLLDFDVMRAQVPSIPEPPLPRVPRTPSRQGAGEEPPGEPNPTARIIAPEPVATTPVAPVPESMAPGPGPDAGAGSNLIEMPTGGAPPVVPSPGRFGFNDTPVMLGDQAPAALLNTAPLPPPTAPLPSPPPRAPVPGQAATAVTPTASAPTANGHGRPALFLPWARGFKIAENQSPMPQDRLFYSFNYFNNLNGDVNQRLGANVTGMQAYRELFGFEKTFLDGNASFGLRLPINTLSAASPTRSFGGTSTAVGNMTVFGKALLLTESFTRSVLSAGLALTLPTGPASFGGARGVQGFREAQFQPFLGYIWRNGDFYVQGFSAIDVPTAGRDVTMWYNDIGIGYFLYRSASPTSFFSAVVPTFEVHVNDPLNHRGVFRANDPAGTADVVDLTFGTNVVLRGRSILSFALVDAVTGPRPFNLEAAVFFNYYFGGSRLVSPALPPPVAGQ